MLPSLTPHGNLHKSNDSRNIFDKALHAAIYPTRGPSRMSGQLVSGETLGQDRESMASGENNQIKPQSV